MTDLAKTIEIIFTGTDDLSGVISTIGSNTTELGQGLQTISQPFADIAEGVLKVEAALAALAVGGLSYSLAKAVEFESSVVELNKVLGDNPTALQAASEAAVELSNQYGQSSSSILSSTAEFKQAGYTVQEAMQLTKDALDLVIVGDMEAAEASGLLVAALKGFEAPASDASRLMDILNETSNNYATNVEELAQGMARVSPIASQMGFSMEETAGLLTPIIEVFRSGDEAANGLRTGLLQLTNDSKPVTDTLTALGVSQTNVNGTLKSGKEIFYEVASAMGGLDDAQRSFYTQQLVGIEQAPKLSILFSDMSKVLDVTTTAMGAAGSAAAEVAVYLESGPVAAERFITAWDNLATAIGTQFIEAAKQAANGATEVEISLQNIVNSGTFDPVFSYISTFASELGVKLKEIAANLPEAMAGLDFSGFLGSFDSLGEAIANIFSSSNIDFSSAEGIKQAVQDVLDSIESLTTVTAGMVNIAAPVISVITDLVRAYNSLSPAVKESEGEVLALMATLSGVGGLLVTGGAVVTGLSNLLSFIAGPAGLTTAAGSAVTGLGLLATGLGVVGTAAALVVGANSLATWLAGVQDHGEATSEAMTKLQDNLQAYKDFSGNTSLPDSISELSGEANMAVAQFVTLKEHIQDLPTQVQTDIMSTFKEEGYLAAVTKLKEIDDGTTEASVEVNINNTQLTELYNRLADIPEEKLVTVQALMDAGEYQAALDMISDIPTDTEIAFKLNKDEAEREWHTFKVELEDGSVVEYTVEVDSASAEAAKKKVDEKLPAEKEMEIQVKLETAKIEAATKQFSDLISLAETTVEWNAKINIAQIEADAEQAKAAFEAIGDSVVATSSAAADMLSSILGSWGDLSSFDQFEFMQILDDQMEIQQQLADSQVKLNDAQINYMNERAKALSQGQAQIQIDTSGLEPVLDMLIWQVFEKVQIKVNEEAAALLLAQ